jgi:hypothetical protein
MTTREIPKPSFKTCDETSLTLVWDGIGNLEDTDTIRLEYKKPNEEWVPENSVAIEKGESEALIVEVIDLEPGNKRRQIFLSQTFMILYHLFICCLSNLMSLAHLHVCRLFIAHRYTLLCSHYYQHC